MKRLSTLCLVLVGGAVACCGTTDPPQSRPGLSAGMAKVERTAPAVLAEPADARAPVVADLKPWFTDAESAAAVADFSAGRNHPAARVFEAIAEREAGNGRGRAAQFLALLARHDGGVFDPTAERLEALAESWPLMADYALFYAASCHHNAGRFDQALAALDEMPVGSQLAHRATELRSRALAGRGDAEAARATLTATLDRNPTARPALWRRLSELRDAAGDADGAKQAVRELATRFPFRDDGRWALARLGDDPGFDTEQWLRLGLEYARVHAHQRARKALGIALEKLPADSADRCLARVQLARTYDKMKRYDNAWTHFRKGLACDGAALADATFAGGRNRLRAGELKLARDLLMRHVAEFEGRSTQDDAMVMVADAYRREDKHEAADRTLLETLDRWPEGDMADDASWSLLWPRVKAHEWKEALEMADRLLELVPRERTYRAEGRTLYWRGRAQQELGDRAAARDTWRAVLEAYPLSWYALLAYGQLAEIDHANAERVLREVVEASELPPDPLAAIPEGLWADVHLRRGVELARMGLRSSARRELRAVRADSGDARTVTWTRAASYGMAGAWDLATQLTRAEEPYFGAQWPVGHHARVWELAHPRPWPELVEEHATQRAIDPHWIWSIMREESGFDPRIESWANAIGLMQIIMPTAKHLARGTDLEVNATTLRDPAVSVRLGAKYLGSLLGRHPVLPLASAGYNAGGGAVNKWRRKFGDVDLDEFVERIPYREARGYAKRVTRSLARYTWLYDGQRMLRLPMGPPGRP